MIVAFLGLILSYIFVRLSLFWIGICSPCLKYYIVAMLSLRESSKWLFWGGATACFVNAACVSVLPCWFILVFIMWTIYPFKSKWKKKNWIFEFCSFGCISLIIVKLILVVICVFMAIIICSSCLKLSNTILCRLLSVICFTSVKVIFEQILGS